MNWHNPQKGGEASEKIAATMEELAAGAKIQANVTGDLAKEVNTLTQQFTL